MYSERSNGTLIEPHVQLITRDPSYAPPPHRPPARLVRGRVRWFVILGMVLAALGLTAYVWSRSVQAPASAVATVAPPVAHGEVEPVARARVGTVNGGQVTQVNVAAGDRVQAQQAIARVNGPDGLEVIFAPWAGTVTGVLVENGDTVAPGAIVATIGDLSRLQVATTDVDEFLIDRFSRGTPVRLTVDAIDASQIHGVVGNVAIEPRTNANGDRAYPATIELIDPPANLQPGMTVRVYLDT